MSDNATREEARNMAAVIMYAASGIDLDAASSGTPEAISACRVTDALMALGYTRQPPASTTAAPVWDAGFNAATDWWFEAMKRPAEQPAVPLNPYRLAAPEGDGGNG